jgi:serine/threonine protein kinase
MIILMSESFNVRRILTKYLEEDPLYLSPLGIGPAKVVDGGVQGAIITEVESNDPVNIKLRLLHEIRLPGSEIQRVNSATYHEEPGRNTLDVDGKVITLSNRAHLDLQTTVSEFVSLSQAYGAHNIQQVHLTNAEDGSLSVPSRSLFSLDGNFGFAFRYKTITGQTLTKHLKESTLTPNAHFQIHADLNTARSELRQRGIVHHDIKPSNIIVDLSGRAHLIDFGLAHIIDGTKIVDSMLDRQQLVRNSSSRQYHILGTIVYLAPEVLPSEKFPLGKVTPAVDTYAQGIIFYESFLGAPPFIRRNSSKESEMWYLSKLHYFGKDEWEIYRNDLLTETNLNGDLAEGAALLFHPYAEKRDDTQFKATLDLILKGEIPYERNVQVLVDPIAHSTTKSDAKLPETVQYRKRTIQS